MMIILIIVGIEKPRNKVDCVTTLNTVNTANTLNTVNTVNTVRIEFFSMKIVRQVSSSELQMSV